MAKLRMEDKEEEVEDGGSIIKSCENLDVIFGCQDGLCHTCKIIVVSGKENLNDKTQVEKEAEDVTGEERLACQCKIKKGLVEIKNIGFYS